MKHKLKNQLFSPDDCYLARRALLIAGHSHRSAAAEIGIHPSLLSQIVYGRRACSDEIRARIMGIKPRIDVPKKSYLKRAAHEFQEVKKPKGHGK